MAQQKFLWNTTGDRCIKLSLVKEFTIAPSVKHSGKFQITAWLGQADAVVIGDSYTTARDAQISLAHRIE